MVILDFSSVEFMSRSFAHEYLKLKRISNKLIKEENTNEEIREMFNIASKPKPDLARDEPPYGGYEESICTGSGELKPGNLYNNN